MSGRYLVRDFIIDEYKIAVNAVLTKALQGMETDNFEFPFITKSGQRVEVLLNATTRRDTSGKLLGVVGVGQGAPRAGRRSETGGGASPEVG